MTALAGPVPAGPAAASRAPHPPWTRLIWVTWRQHRATLTGLAALCGLLALGMLLTGLHVRAGYAAFASCQAAGNCNPSDPMFSTSPFDAYPAVADQALRIVVILAGMFLGAPLVASELDHGTYRFAWTQGTGRLRWLTAKLLLLALPLAAAATGLGVLAQWSVRPYELLGYASGWQPGQFDVTGVTLPAWTLASFAAGTAAGALLRRAVPAVAATCAVMAALVIGAFWKLDALLLSAGLVVGRFAPYIIADTYPTPGRPAGSWQVRSWFTGPDGQPLRGSALQYVYNHLPVKSPAVQLRWLAHHHDAFLVAYQPAGRFWLFHAAQAGILLLLAAGLAAVTVALVRRRA